jgi:hypothetical protein
MNLGEHIEIIQVRKKKKGKEKKISRKYTYVFLQRTLFYQILSDLLLLVVF